MAHRGRSYNSHLLPGRAAIGAAHDHARGLLDRLDRFGEIAFRALVPDDHFPEPADRFGDFHRQAHRFHFFQREPDVFTINPVAKPKSNVRGSIARGNLSRLAVLRPEPELMTSI